MKIILLSISLLLATTIFGQHRTVMYVTGGKTDDINKNVESQFRRIISGSRIFVIGVEDSEFARIINDEKKLQTSGQIADKELRNFGKKAKADFVCAVELIPIENDGYFISARILDVNKASINSATNGIETTVKETAKLMEFAQTVAKDLVNNASKNTNKIVQNGVAIYLHGDKNETNRVLEANLVSVLLTQE